MADTERFIEYYEGFTITLQEEGRRFAVYEGKFDIKMHGQVEIPEDVEEVAVAESWDGAREWIDTEHKQRVKAKKAAISIPLQTKDGAPVTVTGIHMGTKNLTGEGVKDDQAIRKTVVWLLRPRRPHNRSPLWALWQGFDPGRS